MDFTDVGAQLERRKQVFGLYLKQMGDIIGSDGAWHGSEAEMGMREKIWHCLALLEGNGGQIERANRILKGLPLETCHFAPMNCMQLLLKHEGALSKTIVAKLEEYVKSSLARLASDGVHFTMYNDNFASMAESPLP